MRHGATIPAPGFFQEVSMKISQSSLLAISLALAAGAVQAGECTPGADAAATPKSAAAMPAPAHAVYYNPWADLMRMQAAMDSQFNAMNALLQPMLIVPQPNFAMSTPVSALQRTPDGYRLDIPLHGFKAEDIHVRLDGQLLAITAETSSSGTLKVGQQDEQSRSSRSFAETLTLPGPVEASQLQESFKDGVLTLTIPARKNSAGPV
jgi:HSP20 family protein